VEWIWNRSANGYRLPTEAEWEYADRAGTTTDYSFGNDTQQLGEHAWFSQNSKNRLRPVGTRRPNPWHLFDMHGLVWEWTWDSFQEYANTPVVDPSISELGHNRVLRGGSFEDEPSVMRSAERHNARPTSREHFIGFRCVRAARPRLKPPLLEPVRRLIDSMNLDLDDQDPA